MHGGIELDFEGVLIVHIKDFRIIGRLLDIMDLHMVGGISGIVVLLEDLELTANLVTSTKVDFILGTVKGVVHGISRGVAGILGFTDVFIFGHFFLVN